MRQNVKEPTALEQYQQERIYALEKEVERLNGLLNPAQRTSTIDINDPVFDTPVTTGTFKVTYNHTN